MASWGFIVIANDDDYSWNGFSTDMSLNELLKANENQESIFYQKINREAIRTIGHSQGGVGVINAFTNTPHSDLYKTAVLFSPTNPELATRLVWDYNISKVKVPVLMLAGTGKFDKELIIPLKNMEEMYQNLNQSLFKVMAR